MSWKNGTRIQETGGPVSSPLFTCPSSVPTARLRQRSRGVIYTAAVVGGVETPPPCKQMAFTAHTRSGVKQLSAAHRQVPSIFPSHSPCATRPLHYRLLACLGRLGIPSLVCPSSQQQAGTQAAAAAAAVPQQGGGIIQVQRQRERRRNSISVSRRID